MIAINPFVYERTYHSDIKCAAIPALLQEHYSQCGEDLILIALFQALIDTGRIKEPLGGYCFEVGANHGFSGSNTVLIEQYFSAKCFLIEANPDLLVDLKLARPLSVVIHAAVVDYDADFVELSICNHHEISSLNRDFVEQWHDGRVGIRELVSVPARRMNSIFKECVPMGAQINFLSIDIEGYDLNIVKDIDFTQWRPIFVQMEPSEQYSPGEAERMRGYMETQGYVLVAKTNVNLLFLDKLFLQPIELYGDRKNLLETCLLLQRTFDQHKLDGEARMVAYQTELARLQAEIDVLNSVRLPTLERDLDVSVHQLRVYQDGLLLSAHGRLGFVVRFFKKLFNI